MTTRSTLVIQSAEEAYQSELARELGLESLLVVPVLDREASWGALVIGFRTPHQIRPDLIELAEGLARLFAFGLATRRRPETVGVGEPLFEAISALMLSSEVETLLAKVMEAALSVSHGHLGWIGIWKSDALHCVTADGESFTFPRELLADPTTDDGRGPVGQILRTGQMMVMPNIEEEPTLLPWLPALLQDGIRSALGIPLIDQGEILGLLKVYHSQVNGFEPGRVRRMEALASLATMVLRQGRQIDQVESKLLQSKQAILRDVLPIITEAETTAHIVEVIAETFRGMIEGTSAAIYTVDDESVSLWTEVGLPDWSIDESALLESGSVKDVMATKSPYFSPEPLAAAPHQGLVIFPMVAREQTIGFITAIAPFAHLERFARPLKSYLVALAIIAASVLVIRRLSDGPH